MPAGARQATLEAVRRMAGAIVHRGPDDEGCLRAASDVVIGMRRLSIIDLSGGHQPIANEDETLWVVCNGEIYNFQRAARRAASAPATASAPAATSKCCCTSTRSTATLPRSRLRHVRLRAVGRASASG